MRRLEPLIQELAGLVASLESDCLDGPTASRLVSVFAQGQHCCAAGQALCARRVEQTNAWRADGSRTPQEWLAATTKMSPGAAIDTLGTARRLEGLPATRHAFTAGEVTAEQAHLIAQAADVDPSAEATLLDQATNGSLRQLQRSARAAMAAASADQATQQGAVRASRYLRTWDTRDGAIEGRFRLPLAEGALLQAALDTETNHVFAQARHAGHHDPSQAYAADALVNLACRQPGDRPAPPAVAVNVRVDAAAFLRGATAPGEVCEITNVGPIPPDQARHLAEDAYLRLHLVDGDRVIDAVNLGRTIPTRTRMALEERDRRCAVPGCDTARHLEIHHIKPFVLGGPTTIDNLVRICSHHHALVSNHGAAITGSPGHWRWSPPKTAAAPPSGHRVKP